MSSGPRTLVWLASYPKSGNTWLRAFLANYLLDSDQPVPIDRMQQISFSDSSTRAYAELGRCNPMRLSPPQIVALRIPNLERIARRGQVNFVKTHNPHVKVAGHWLMPAHLTHAAVYIIRDPRDMVLSYADHFALDPAAAAAAIASPRNHVPTNARTVLQFLGNWSEHVRSWTRAGDIRVLVLRYEDMLADPQAAFGRMLRHIGAPFDEATLEQAIRFSSFDVLAGQEAEDGFSEKGATQARFFRRGACGQWRGGLAPEVAARIAADHGPVMREFGYSAK